MWKIHAVSELVAIATRRYVLWSIQLLGDRLVSTSGQFKQSPGSSVSHICDGSPHSDNY